MNFNITLKKEKNGSTFSVEEKINLVGITAKNKDFLQKVMDSDFRLTYFENGERVYYSVGNKEAFADIKDFLTKKRLLVIFEEFSGEKHTIYFQLMQFNNEDKKKLFYLNGIVVNKNGKITKIYLANKNDLSHKDFGLNQYII